MPSTICTRASVRLKAQPTTPSRVRIHCAPLARPGWIARKVIAVFCGLFLYVHGAHADICFSKDPRDSCLGYGAAALLKHEGIIKITKTSLYPILSEENGRPKGIFYYNIHAEFLRDPSDEEWQSIEAELIDRVVSRVCFRPVGLEHHGVVEMGVSRAFIEAGGILETKVILRVRRDGPGTARLDLLDFKVTSCGNVRFNKQLLSQVDKHRPFLIAGEKD